MSIAGIASTLLSQLSSLQNKQQSQASTEFQQLAQDLNAGNLSKAQSDFAALQQNAPATQASSGSSLSQAIGALGNDLQSGNLSAAQKDFATIQQDVSSASSGAQAHRHRHHAAGSSQQNSIAQLFSTLGQDLQSGNLSSAQQAYSALQQDLQQIGGNVVPSSAPAAGSVSLTA